MRWVGDDTRKLPKYEGFPNLMSFLIEFEAKVIESQRFSTFDFVMKATLSRWWGTHKQSIFEWTQCRRLMEIVFIEDISYTNRKYT